MSEDEDIEFWFDLSSPYAYFAALEIDALAARHGRLVHWRPFLLGVLLRVSGNIPLSAQPLKGKYARRDWERLARCRDVAFVLRPDFPLATQAAARMVLAVERSGGRRCAGRLARRMFEALFGEGLEISRAEVAAEVGAAIGLDPAALLGAADDPSLKRALREQCAEAERRGIFGAPWIEVDGEPFWGSDRLAMIDRWLSRNLLSTA